MNRFDLILAVVAACILWAVGSWYWYTCGINDACGNARTQSAWIGGAWEARDQNTDERMVIPVDERDNVPVRNSDRRDNM